MQSSGEDDLISRARALDFLASTLQILSRKNDTLNAEQIKLLVTFFSTLFENDQKAGVTASAKALRHLIAMRHFQPTLGHEIMQRACKLGEDFKLQAPATRLELYHLFWSLLENPAVAYDLEYGHGNPGGIVLDLLSLCRNERDPENLMMWFAILRLILQDFNPSTDTTSEVFKAFSAYFPISLRPSATPSIVTTDNLKAALRSCFSAHHRLAGLSIPFLVDKLDKVDQTVAVKVDILLTLDACLSKYEDPKENVKPHADHIWSSLKYEVRNGEIQDIIKATLKVLSSLTRRLDGEELKSFLDNAWRDLKEDLSDSKYTAQAGRLLVAVVGATAQSFALLIPRALEHIKNTIKHTNSVLHKRHLITLMSSILKLRLLLVPDLVFNTSISEDAGILSDDLFGDSLFHELYLPFWQEHSAASSSIEYIGILQETMQGLGALVGQTASGKQRLRLCSDSTCETILSLLVKPVIICPLEGPKYFDTVDEKVPQDLLDAGEEALRNAVPLYPPSFRYLLLQYLASIKAAFRLQPQPSDLAFQIRGVSATLCAIIHLGTLDPNALWLNQAALINTFLQGLQWMLSKQADPMVLVVFIDTIHVTLKRAFKQAERWDANPKLTKESLLDFVNRLDSADAPRLDLDRPGNIEALELEETGHDRPRRAYCLFVVQQLYRRFTTVATNVIGAPFNEYLAPRLSRDLTGDAPDLILRQDLFLNQIGQLATSVIRELGEDEQKALELDYEAFSLFHPPNSTQGLTLPWSVSPADQFRTAPLSLGIIQGLWPGAINPEVSSR
jgi:DNA repair/transcription protein MET18/MMS19